MLHCIETVWKLAFEWHRKHKNPLSKTHFSYPNVNKIGGTLYPDIQKKKYSTVLQSNNNNFELNLLCRITKLSKHQFEKKNQYLARNTVRYAQLEYWRSGNYEIRDANNNVLCTRRKFLRCLGGNLALT